jgi:hypothetical protein
MKKSIKGKVELELDCCLVIVVRLLSRLSCYRGKVGAVEINSVELLVDGWEVKCYYGKRNRGGD